MNDFMRRHRRFAVAVIGLAGAIALAAAQEAPEPVDSKSLAATVITPELETAIEPGKNLLYCATFQLAWNEFRTVKEDHLPDEPEVIQRLDAKAFSKEDLSEESYLTAVGFLRDGIVEKINRDLQAKFGDEAFEVAVPGGFSPAALFAYAFLYKNLRFANTFEDLEDPVLFIADGKGTLVDAFGIDRYAPANEKQRALADQVAVLDYRSERDFILRLASVSPDDEIVLAMLKPKKTLRQTVEAARERVGAAEEDSLREKEEVRIPVVDFDLEHAFPAIERYLRALVEGPAKALQRIRFRLNEEGALLKSEARIVAESMRREEPRRFVFNRPFLIYLKQKSSDRPYLALWVAHPELLQTVSPPPEGGSARLRGQRLVLSRCTMCHDLERVGRATFDREGWAKTVDRMIDNGAKLGDAERSLVIEYLIHR